MRSAPVLRRISALLLVGFAVSCTKAKLGDPTPTGITVSTDATTISADSGSLTVHAQAFENGVALLDQPITFTVTGASNMTAPTDPLTGVATATFTGLTTPGVLTVTASAGVTAPVTASSSVTVVHGAPASLALNVASQSVDADTGTVTFGSTVKDKSLNVIDDATVAITTDAPGAQVGATTIAALRTAGSFHVFGRIAGVTTAGVAALFTDSDDFTVTHGVIAHTVTSLSQGAVGQLSSMTVTCGSKDAYGNDAEAAFSMTDVAIGGGVTATVAPTVAANTFTVSNFSAAGPATVSCTKSALSDVRAIQVVAQAASNSVAANTDASVVEAGGSVVLSCSEVDTFGNPVSTTFTPTITSQPSGASPVITGSSPNFTISNLTPVGTYTLVCADPAMLSASRQISVVDTTAPTAAISFLSASGAYSSTLDSHYAPGTILTVHVAATDASGRVASEAISATGPVVVLGSAVHAEPNNSGSSASWDFQVQITSDARAFRNVSITAQATDGSGNAGLATGSVDAVVDPGAGILAATGVTIRTFYEEVSDPQNSGLPIPRALVASNGVVYVTVAADLNRNADRIIRIATQGTASTTFMSDLDAGVGDNATLGLVRVPGGYGGFTMFQTLAGGGTTSVVGLSTSSAHFATSNPGDVTDAAYGTVDTTTALWDWDAVTGTVGKYDSSGVRTIVIGLGVQGAGVAVDSTSKLLLSGSNQIFSIDSVGGVTAIALTGTTIGGSLAVDSTGRILLGGDLYGPAHELTVFPAAGPTGTTISSHFEQIRDIAIENNTLYVADYDSAHSIWRVYTVTGF